MTNADWQAHIDELAESFEYPPTPEITLPEAIYVDTPQTAGPSRSVPRTRRPEPRRRAPALALALMGFLLVAGVMVILFGRGPEQPVGPAADETEVLTEPDWGFIRDLPGDIVLIRMDYLGGLIVPREEYPPEFLLTADGSITYRVGADEFYTGQVSQEEMLAIMHGLWEAGYPRLESYQEECYPAEGAGTCVSDATTMQLDVRLSPDQLRMTLNYHDFAPDREALRSVRGYLERYTVPETPVEESPLTLQQNDWLLTHINGEPTIEGSFVTLRFRSAGTFGGFGGCNDYGGAYSRTGMAISFEEIGANAQACLDPTGVTAQEMAYLNALRTVDTIDYDPDGPFDQPLTLSGGGQSLTFEPVFIEEFANQTDDLIGVWWVLLRWGDEPVSGLYSLRVNTDGTFEGFAGCRGYEGEYLIEGGSFFRTSLMMTDDVCLGPDELLQREGEFTTALSQFDSWRVGEDDSLLFVTTKPGEELIFAPQSAEPTAQPIPWGLSQIRTADEVIEVGQGEPVTLYRQAGEYRGFIGCWQYSLELQPREDDTPVTNITLDETGCASDAALTASQQRYLDDLGQVVSILTQGDSVVLTVADGTEYIFTLP